MYLHHVYHGSTVQMATSADSCKQPGKSACRVPDRSFCPIRRTCGRAAKSCLPCPSILPTGASRSDRGRIAGGRCARGISRGKLQTGAHRRCGLWAFSIRPSGRRNGLAHPGKEKMRCRGLSVAHRVMQQRPGIHRRLHPCCVRLFRSQKK